MTDVNRGVAHYAQINAGARLYGINSNRSRTITAGSVSSEDADNVFHEGQVIDRTSPALFLSGQGVVSILPVLNTAETATLSRRYRHADDPAGPWTELPSLLDAEIADVVITAAEVVATPGPRSYRDNLDLAGAKRYLRQDIRVNLSRANTDIARIAGVVALAGDDAAPVA